MPALEDLYREIILDHYRSPRNRGELAVPPARRVEGFNPLCGDEVVVYAEVDGDKLADIRISGQGCSISQSSASLMSTAVKGLPLGEVREVIRTFKSMMSLHEAAIDEHGDHGGEDGDDDGEHASGTSGDSSGEGGPGEEPVDLEKLGELAALQGVVKFPVRIKCATLAWNTLVQAIDEAESSSGEE
ncbi:MAG: SUF system NifU family Fe-S cluster assembly protein [Actinobacteria bacterium]|nr:SUF system NifU family Fe-S cluster assembly protein [Actinomycetota bacterium]